MTTAQLIVQRQAQYKDNQDLSNLLTIMKQMNESLDVAIVKVNAALVKLEKLEADRLYVGRQGS